MAIKTAVIGGGIAGISAAYRLAKYEHISEITLFEANPTAGGHANTIEVSDATGVHGLDTAFIIFNSKTYPQFSNFLTELEVPDKNHVGGFNFFDRDNALEFGSEELGWPIEKAKQFYPEEFIRLFAEAKRFFSEGPKDFIRRAADLPLADYLAQRGYSDHFKYSFVMSLCTVVWSIPPEKIWEMPASTLIVFFMSHDPAGLGGKSVAWKTVAGGSRTYVRRALELSQVNLRLSTPVEGVREFPDHVLVRTNEGVEAFDYVILATHADQALAMLEQPAPQHLWLKEIQYNHTVAVLHTDESVLSPNRERWQSWNYGTVRVHGRPQAYNVYYLNKIHGITAEKNYFVTIDYPGPIADDKVIDQIHYTHPIINLRVRQLQEKIYQLNELGRIKFAGSYFHSKQFGPDLIGSHEAAFSSGAEAAKSVLKNSRYLSAQPALS